MSPSKIGLTPANRPMNRPVSQDSILENQLLKPVIKDNMSIPRIDNIMSIPHSTTRSNVSNILQPKNISSNSPNIDNNMQTRRSSTSSSTSNGSVPNAKNSKASRAKFKR